MSNRIEDLWQTAAHDGAFAPVGVSRHEAPEDHSEVLNAWFHERQQTIELRLYLEQARTLLSQILNDGEMNQENRRRTRLLLLAIRAAERANRRRGR